MKILDLEFLSEKNECRHKELARTSSFVVTKMFQFIQGSTKLVLVRDEKEDLEIDVDFQVWGAYYLVAAIIKTEQISFVFPHPHPQFESEFFLENSQVDKDEAEEIREFLQKKLYSMIGNIEEVHYLYPFVID